MDAIKQIYTHLNLRGNQIIGLRPEVSPEEPDYIEGGIYYNPARKTFYGGVSGAWTPFGVSQGLLDKIDTLLDYWSLENGVLKTDYPMMARGYAAGATASVGEGGGGGGAILNKESIITALGYTPYDSANPKGYITVSALTGYATQDYVSQQISNIDLSPYAKTEDVAAMYVTRDSFSPIEDYYNAISPNIYKVGDVLKLDAEVIANNHGSSASPLWVKGTDTWAGIRFNSAYLGYFGGFDWRITNEGYGQDTKILHEQNYSKYALPLTGGWVSSSETNTPLTISATNASTTILRVVNGNVAGTLSVSTGLALGLSGGTSPQIQIHEHEDSPIWRKNYVNKYILHEGNYTSYTYSQSTIDSKLAGYLPLSGGALRGDLNLQNNKLSFVNAILSNDGGLAMKYSADEGHEFYTAQGKKILSLNSSADRVTIYGLGIDSDLGPVPSLTVYGGIYTDGFIYGSAGDILRFGSNHILSIGAIPPNNVNILNLCGYDRIDFTLVYDKRMSILSNGNVLIGTTEDNGAKLQVNGGVSIASGYTLKIGDATISYVNGVLKVDKPFMSKGYAAGATASVSSSGGGVILNKESIIEALGYTPYDAANPSNYTTRSAIFTGSASQFLKADGSVDSTAYLPLSGGQMTGDGKISWGGGVSGIRGTDNGLFLHAPLLQRRASDGNYYTVLDSGNVGDYALPLKGGTIRGPLTINTDRDRSLVLDEPTGEQYHIISFAAGGEEYASLRANNLGSTNRLEFNGNIVVHTGNIGLYRAGDSLMLGGTSPTSYLRYGDQLTSNVDANELRGMTFHPNVTGNGSGNTNMPVPYGYLLNLCNSAASDISYFKGVQISFGTNNVLQVRYHWEYAWRPWKIIALTDSNVASATKLATARTIWGQSFDGTGNVSGALSGVTNINGALYINSSGNVTIGNGDNAGADYKLWVTGDARIEGSIAMSGGLKFMDGYTIQTYNNSPLSINALGNNILLGPNGNIKVGVCTDNPQYNLDVNGTIGVYESLNFTRPSWNYVTVPTTNGALAFNVGAAGMANTKMCINNRGNVGIGTTTPAYTLDVAGTGRFTGAVTMNGALSMGASAYFKGTHFNGYAFFNSGGEGIYISNSGQSINWHDASNTHVRAMMGFAADSITIHRDLLPSAGGTYNLGGNSARWNNLYCGAIWTSEINTDFLYVNEGIYSEGEIYSEWYIHSDEYISTDGDVRASGFLQTASGIKIGDATITYENGVLKIDKPLMAKGYIAGATATVAN